MTGPPAPNLEAREGSRFVEEDVEPEVPVGHLDGVAHQALGSRCHGGELDRRQSLRILNIERVSYFNSYLRDGYRGCMRRKLGDAGF